MSPSWSKLAREPLLHFLLAGAALFALERAVRSQPRDRPGEIAPARDGRIVVGPDIRALLVERFRAAETRAPSPEELDKLLSDWTDEEVLYRAGLERGLDRDDARVRERVAQKMAFVLRSRVVVPAPSEAELRAYFERDPGRWAKAALLDFVHVFVSGEDAAAEARASGLLADLRAGADPSALGEPFSGGRRYRRRKVEDLAKAFGDEFVRGLSEQPEQTWERRRSRFGLHLLRVERRTPPEAPVFEAVKADVQKEWEAERRSAVLAEAMKELRAGWEIVEEPARAAAEPGRSP